MIGYNWCIDAGNTSIKWGVFSGSELIEVIQLFEEPTSEWVNELSNRYSPKRILVSSVRGELTFLKKWNTEEFSIDCIPQFKVDYSAPLEMGIDRIAAALGAYSKFPNSPCILIIDMGTCVTYTLLKNLLISGLSIHPGLNMRWKAMHEFTAQLPLINHSSEATSKGTVDNLIKGGRLGWQKEMDGMIDLFCEDYKVDQVVFTGSDVVHLENKPKENKVNVDHLNLWGLNYCLNEG